MSANRKNKLRQRAKREKKLDQDRRACCEQFLVVMGINSIVERFPHPAKQLIWTYHDLKPIVCIEPHAPESDQLRNLLDRATSALNERKRVDFLGHRYEFSYSDYLVTYEPLFSLLGAMSRSAARGEDRLGIDANLAIELWKKSVDFHSLGRLFLLADLSADFESVFREFSGVEQCAWHRRDRIKTESMRGKTTFYISVTKVERLNLNIDGATRPVFRCCKKEGGQGLRYLDVPGDLLGKGPESKSIPLYIQRHAVERLEERLGIHNQAFLSMIRAESLDRPIVSRRNDGSFLIEVRLGLKRIGYFVAEMCGNMLIIRTFLFLTMQGTPESDLLRSELSLRRADIEYTMLDSFLAFANSDMKNDKTLVALFDKCGCGHLFSLVNLEREARQIPRQAQMVRDHLKIQESEGRVLVGGRSHELDVGDVEEDTNPLLEWLIEGLGS